MSTSIWAARELGEDTSWLNPPDVIAGTVVGGDNALDTDDGDASYVVVSQDEILLPEVKVMPFVWERISGTAPAPGSVTSITVDVVYRMDDAHTVDGPAAGRLVARLDGVAGTVVTWAFAESTTWETQSDSISPFYAPYIVNGQSWNIAPFAPGFVGLQAFRVTYLRLTMEGGAPLLRQRNRGKVRARLRADRQRSIRSRGFL